MIDVDARNLAERITRSWRGGIGTEIWYEVLTELVHGPAESAFKSLRDNEEHQPSIAKFRATYRAQFGTAREEKTACGLCGGDGWETVVVGPTEFDTVVAPCRCPNGRNVEDVHRRIVAANLAELDRIGRRPPEDSTRRPDWLTGRPQHQEAMF
jgi:hypothetical protein